MDAMVSSVTNKGLGNVVSQRLKKLEAEGKAGNDSLFRVVNLLTGTETHVPGGVIGRFVNPDYFVEYVGENKPNAIVPTTDESGQAVAQQIIADAQAQADAIVAKAKADASRMGAKLAKKPDEQKGDPE